ncbi:MAG: hypothetical protein ACLT29_05185 [Ruminococcus callidus]
MTSAIQGEVCSRFGGDEFTVAGGIADMDDNYFESFRERFREYLRQYNQISRKHIWWNPVSASLSETGRRLIWIR